MQCKASIMQIDYIGNANWFYAKTLIIINVNGLNTFPKRHIRMIGKLRINYVLFKIKIC